MVSIINIYRMIFNDDSKGTKVMHLVIIEKTPNQAKHPKSDERFFPSFSNIFV